MGMIVCSMFALYLLLALASFDPADPSWSQAGFRDDVQNAAGAIGAWFADILLNSFGYIAYVFPFGIALLGWFLFQQTKNLLELDYLTIGLRLIGFILSIVGATALFSLNADDIYVFSAGGFVGDAISGRLLPYFNLAGTTLLLLCFLCTGLTLMTGISWLLLIDHLGDWAISGVKWLGRLPSILQGMQVPTLPKRKHNDNDMVEMADKPKSESVAEETPPWGATPVPRREPVIEPVFSLDNDEDFDMGEVPLFDEPAPAPKPAPVKTKGDKAKPKTLAELEEEFAVEGERPSFMLLDRPDKVKNPISPEELEAASRLVEAKLQNFSIEAKVVGVYPGPVITRFELDLAPGVKVAKISSLAKDLARELSAISVRVVEVIPGKSVIGLELPNKHREMVRLSEVIECDVFQNSTSNLTMVLGKDIAGKPVVVDLAKMPHLLVAGTTGSGKSVGVNVMILSLLYKSSPEDVRMIMIDPKMLELSVYEGIPHLLAEVVTDMKEAANALRWCVGEMERRYRLMSALGVRNLKGYNTKIADAIEAGEPIKDPLWKPEQSMEPEAPDLEKLPSIVVVVDEFADMMMIVGKKVEELIARIAQKARAAGIHLVLATQRPSVDVITGLIKANIPTRIAFQVSSKIDSRTILDQQGAEALLGQGDMLYLPPGTGVPTRVHGAFVDDHEVHAVVADWKKRGKPNYIDEILSGEGSTEVLLPGEQAEGEDAESDPLYDDAVSFVTQSRRASVSSVQRQFRIGYNRAARIVEQMEMSGVVSAQGHNGNREVLAPPPV
ncbi:hypothetical protein GCM10009092_06690 [Bowmanella denitrificans]|uniref:DNA translocase FtsK n=1 Tax=Bowmanella denitrificans TaxID=366582 RepID=A0ABP3GJ92_9ALTE